MGPIQELYKLCLYYCQCVDLFYVRPYHICLASRGMGNLLY